MITGGCLLWGIMTGGFSLCTVLWQVTFLLLAPVCMHCALPGEVSSSCSSLCSLSLGRQSFAAYNNVTIPGLLWSTLTATSVIRSCEWLLHYNLHYAGLSLCLVKKVSQCSLWPVHLVLIDLCLLLDCISCLPSCSSGTVQKQSFAKTLLVWHAEYACDV